MNQYNEISTLQYMGSKTRIISHICEPIIKNKSIKTVVDLFAGTGPIGYIRICFPSGNNKEIYQRAGKESESQRL